MSEEQLPDLRLSASRGSAHLRVLQTGLHPYSLCRFETAWPIPLVVVAATCGLFTVIAWAIVAVKMSGLFTNSDDEDEHKEDEDKDGDNGVIRLVLHVAGVITFGIAISIICWLRRRVTLKNHVEALHLLYVYDKMPLTGAAHVQFQMTLKTSQRNGLGGKVKQDQHYTVYSDGSFREDAERTCW